MKLTTGNGKLNTREVILQTLKSTNQAKVDDLAEAANVSPVTIRHHLNSLQADNLIEVGSVRLKVGRPYYVYSLSEKGHELFPHKYVSLTKRLLDELKEHLPAETVTKLFSGIVQNIIDKHRGKFESLDAEKRLPYLVDLLSEEGFLADWDNQGDEYKLTVYSCPYFSLVETHSEICQLDRELIFSVLQGPVTQHGCIIDGDTRCEFTFLASEMNSK